MKTRTLKQLLLYNYRYYFGYTIIIGFMAYFLGWRLGGIGPGLAQQEIAAASRSVTLGGIAEQPLYPLHALLQWGSMKLFEISSIYLRLPSIVLAIMTAICLYSLLRRWFGKSTALLTTAIFISADWFLFIARLGTGAIEFSFWLTLALVCLTKLLERKQQWMPVLALSLAGLLFAPLGIYVAITLVASLFTIRVFRERLQETEPKLKILSISILVACIGIFGYVSFGSSSFIKNILGIQAWPGITGYLSNVFTNLAGVVAVFPNANPAISPTGLFFVRYFELIFILFGIIMLWRTRVNRLNVIVLVMSVALVLVSGFSAGSRGSGALLVPAAIYMTAGIRHLMHRWKRTFPKNPYARIAAYSSLGCLFFCVVFAHYLNYFVVWPANTDTHIAFTKDFTLLQKELNRSFYKDQNCLVQTNDEAVKKLLLASKTTCKPNFPDNLDALSNIRTLILQPGSNGQVFIGPDQTSRALASEATNNSTRWVVVSATKQ